MTATDIGPAKALLYAVRNYLDETYPHWPTRWGALPAGLRLEVHPRVHYTLAADPDTYFWPREPGDSFEELYRRTFGVPVKITPELPAGTWRLVVVTEDVKLAGKLPSSACFLIHVSSSRGSSRYTMRISAVPLPSQDGFGQALPASHQTAPSLSTTGQSR